jgi:hypothetical protein
VNARDVSFDSGGVELAGTVWLPARPRAALVMVGGSGPADRDNDVLFPPMRAHLLGADVAVLSYDKRGVGASSGSWVAATIDLFAADARAAYDTFCAIPEVASVPMGLFGHSEGGWVVLRAAAACAGLAFVVTNSCPGMTPREQDRYAVEVALHAAGEPDAMVAAGLALYDRLVDLLRQQASYAEVQPLLLSEPSLSAYFGDLDEDAWCSAGPKLDHDPAADLAGLTCPHLALFGARDPLVPVAPSVAAMATAVAARDRHGPAMTIEVFAGADHRVRIGDDFAAGYLDTLTGWIGRFAAGRGQIAG